MSRLNAFCVNIKSGILIAVDKSKGTMLIYPAGANSPIFKFNSVFDIIAVRDLLNDAFPVEDFKYDRVR